MEEDCSQWENIAGEFLEKEMFYQAANQYKHAADCYLDKVIEMTRNAAENYHIYAEESVEKDNHKAAATAYFEAATQYRQVSDFATALTLFENAAKEALLVRRTETAAQANLWAAFSCHKLGNREYFLTCAKNMGNLYKTAAEKALDDGNAERAVIDFSLAALGFATIDKMDKAKDLIEKAQRVVDKTTWDWLRQLLSFSEALSNNDLDEAAELLSEFKEEETIQEVMGASLDIREHNARQRRRK